MKSLQSGILAACFFAIPAASDAVTITVNGLIASTATVGTTITDTDAPGESTQILNNNGSITATTPALGQTDLGDGSWEFNGLNTASLIASRPTSTGTNVAQIVAGQVAYQIAFTLGVGEAANISFDLGYSLSEINVDGEITWSFTGPSGSIAAISGGIGATGNQTLVNQNISQQQVLITTAGTYTFNLAGTMPTAGIRKGDSISLSLNSIGFDIIAVPEPSSALLGAAGLGLLLVRRRRSNPS